MSVLDDQLLRNEQTRKELLNVAGSLAGQILIATSVHHADEALAALDDIKLDALVTQLKTCKHNMIALVAERRKLTQLAAGN